MELKIDVGLIFYNSKIDTDENMQLLLLFVLARYEAKYELSKHQLLHGKKKGGIDKDKMNLVLRDHIRNAVKERKRLGIKINGSEIARTHGVSRGWVSKLMKNMGY